jgi:hypothetical protein
MLKLALWTRTLNPHLVPFISEFSEMRARKSPAKSRAFLCAPGARYQCMIRKSVKRVSEQVMREQESSGRRTATAE